MKKIISLLSVFVLVVSITACGGKEQSATYTMQSEVDGLVMTDTMTLDAKGDTVQTMTEVIALDLSSFDESTQTALTETYSTIVDSYNSVEGVECTMESGDGSISITVVIDATGEAVSQLADAGLLQVEGDADRLSLSATGEALVESGYTLVENAEE